MSAQQDKEGCCCCQKADYSLYVEYAEGSNMSVRSKLLLPDSQCEMIASEIIERMSGKRCESWACASVNPACFEVHLPFLH